MEPIKLSELASNIETVIKKAFFNHSYWVIAELTGVKYYPAKNYYFFDLVEKDGSSNTIVAQIKAGAWGSSVSKIRNFEKTTGQKFDNNIQLLLKVSVEYSGKFGLRLNFLDIDHSFTMGNLEKQKKATLQRLLDENPDYIQMVDGEYVTYNKTLSVNPVIQRIALISSANADGYKDFKDELLKNRHGYAFILDEYLAPVQGDSVDLQIVDKLLAIFHSNKAYDAVCIVRGGGSHTDLLIFDSYRLALAVAKFPIPVITGIGHLQNQSVVDLMACYATKTPTKAAESIVAHNRLFEEKLLDLQKNIVAQTKELMARHLLSIHKINAAIIQKTSGLITGKKFQLQRFSYAIINATLHFMSKKQNKIDYFTNFVKHHSPSYVLRQGYALLYQDGKMVKDPVSIKKGAEITALFYDTEIISVVKDKKQIDEPRFKL